ncbi:lysophospholipid acyltransferase family protein [Candidatus Margulisiibacteriota bacterium]
MTLFLKALQGLFRAFFWLPGNWPLINIWSGSWIIAQLLKHTKTKKSVTKNINLLLPNIKASKAADKLLTNTCFGVFELLSLPYFRPGHWQKSIKLCGLENVATAFSGGRGVIILTIHAGNYELIPMTLAHHGYKMNTVLRADDHPVFQLLNKSRSVGGVQLINTLKEDMYKSSIDALAKNDGVFLLADTGALESRHETVEFLGHRVPVATGWLALAQRTGCAVVPTIAYKNGKQNLITLHPPIRVSKENRDQVKLEVLRLFEQHIQANPEQWGLFLNAFETKRVAGKA